MWDEIGVRRREGEGWGEGGEEQGEEQGEEEGGNALLARAVQNSLQEVEVSTGGG